MRHHGVLTLVSAILLAAVYTLVPSPNTIFRWSMATAYASLMLLAGTLLTGPINVLRDRPNPLSTDLRRDIGIWSALLGIVHVVVGLQVHMGNPWLYFLRGQRTDIEFFPRGGLFGWANYIGLAATLVFVLLLVISNDQSLRTLGGPRWKRLQRWNYWLVLLVLVHAVAYQIIEKRTTFFVAVLPVTASAVIVGQLAGRARVRRRD